MGLNLGWLALTALLVACTPRHTPLTLVERDDVYSNAPDRYVWCGSGIDTKPQHHPSLDEIKQAMMRAKDEGTTLHLYAHIPGDTIDPTVLEQILAMAADLGVRLTTYDELSDHEVPGGLALSFDDSAIDAWTSIRPMLSGYQVHVTFFITYFLGFDDAQRAELQQLAADGHDIEYHATSHLDAAKYVADHGVDDYIATDIVPALDAMRAAGYPTRTFAYPYGSRTAATDEALRPYFDHLRGVSPACP
jgi:hypothetical protein